MGSSNLYCTVYEHSNDHDDDDADNVGDDDPYGAHSADAHLSLVSG